MKKKSDKIKKISYAAGTFLAAAAALALPFGLGYSRSGGGLWHLFAWLAFALWFALWLTACVRWELYRKRERRGMLLGQLFELGVRRAELIAEDTAGAEAAFKKAKLRTWGYVLANALLLIAWSYCGGRAAKGQIAELYLGMSVFCLFQCWGLFDFLVRRGADYFAKENELPERAFPAVFSLAQQAAAELGPEKPLRIFFGDGFFAEERKKAIHVSINGGYLSLFSEPELRVLLLRELYISRAEAGAGVSKARRFLRKWSADAGLLLQSWGLFFRNGYCFGERLNGDCYMAGRAFCGIVRRRTERAAEGWLKEKGEGQVCADALAKEAFLRLYAEHCGKRLDEEEFENVPIRGYYARRLAEFETLRKQNAALWTSWIINGLPDELSGERSYAASLKELGAAGFDAEGRPRELSFRREAEKLRERADLQKERESGEVYVACNLLNREKIINSARELIAEAERTGTSPALYGEEMLCFDAWGEVLYGRDEELLRGLIGLELAENPKSAAANYYLGLLKTQRGDETGLAHLYLAAEISPEEVPCVCREAGQFAVRAGREDLLAEYFSRFAFLSRDFLASRDDVSLNPRDKLGPLAFSSGGEEELTARLLSCLGVASERVEKLYAGEKTGKSGRRVCCLAVCFRKKTDWRVSSEIIGKIVTFLENSDFFEAGTLFCVFDGGNKESLKILKKKVFGAKLYDAAEGR